MARVAVCLADGFEDVEAVTPIDLLRRAGVEVVVAGVTGKEVTGSRGVRIVTDALLADLSPEDFDGMVLPGGMPGSSNLAASDEVRAWLSHCMKAGKTIGAICAAPAVVLGKAGLLEGRRFTCYPGMEKEVEGGTWEPSPVVKDGNLITSRGVGTAGLFGLELVRAFAGEEAYQKVGKATLIL